MTDTVITTTTLDSLRDMLQRAGYRAETYVDPDGGTQLRSATAGMAFELRLGNSGSDLTLVTGLQIQGKLPLELVNKWNSSRRFGRLHIEGNVLVLMMDVLVAGGVTAGNIHAHLEIWDHLIQNLVPYLRAEVARPGAVDVGSGAASSAETSDFAAQPAASAA